MSRPPIPSSIKREVRQRCGFGCVICGLPIYQYDHLLGYANVKRHVAKELTLLCPNHHDAKTKGLLSDDVVLQANQAPAALQEGSKSPFALQFSTGRPRFLISGQEFSLPPGWSGGKALLVPLMVNRQFPLAFEVDNGGLLLHMKVVDSNGKMVMRIENSELTVAPDAWDAELVGKTLTLREGHGRIAARVSFAPPDLVVVERLHADLGAMTVNATKDELQLKRSTGGNFITFCGSGHVVASVGINIGKQPPRGMSVGFQVG